MGSRGGAHEQIVAEIYLSTNDVQVTCDRDIKRQFQFCKSIIFEIFNTSRTRNENFDQFLDPKELKNNIA